MNVMNVSVQLGEGNAISGSTGLGGHDASLGKTQWETNRNPSTSTKKGYIDSVTSSSSAHADKSGQEAKRTTSSSGRTRLQSSFPTEDDDEEELHNEVLRNNIVKVDGARRNQAVDQIKGGSSAMPEIPNEMPGLSIITWEEFVVDPALLHNLFSIDKEEFILFDNSIVNNLFHDSRMEPPVLGAPSDDGLSWHIFVDSYSQLRHVREVMTSRISVILVDLVKPNNEGTASCVVAINPMDDHIRRVLHLTLSRAMESVFNSRCFSVEINLNKDITSWCRMVLQTECEVAGGRIVITNGDEPQSFCVVDNPPRCVLCFPVWLYRRIKYMIHRRGQYDDTMVEFDGANFVLCTNSDTLRQYSDSAQLTNGERLIHKNTKAVTMATQTLNTSCTSLKSDLSVEEIDEASDNDVIKKRDGANERGRDLYSFANPTFTNAEEQTTYKQHNVEKSHKNTGKMLDENIKTNSSKHTRLYDEDTIRQTQEPIVRERYRKTDNVDFIEQPKAGTELDIVAIANSPDPYREISSKGEDRFMKNTKQFDEILREDKDNLNKSFDSTEEQVLTPRSRAAFLKRPFTPFIKKPKDRKKEPKSPRHPVVSVINENDTDLRLKLDEPSPPAGSSSKDVVINDKIAKRKKKINELMSDLVTLSNASQNFQSADDVFDNENNDDIVITPLTPRRVVKKPLSEIPVPAKRKVRHTPVQDVQITPRDNPAFPYTSQLLDFASLPPNKARAALEKYGADLGKSNKKQSKTDDMLFQPRLNLDDIEPDRNCFSDLDISDSDVTDLENDQVGAMSDTEGMLSSRYIPVQTTPRTLSLDPVMDFRINNSNNNNNNNKSDLDSDLEITDCDTEEDKQNYKQMNSPRILPGAMAAHELRATSAGSRSRSANARSRDYIPPSAQMNNRRGGNQNDSRRKYLALNSLRRKAYKLALQSQVRSQSAKQRPSSAAELLSYNARGQQSGVVTVISAV